MILENEMRHQNRGPRRAPEALIRRATLFGVPAGEIDELMRQPLNRGQGLVQPRDSGIYSKALGELAEIKFPIKRRKAWETLGDNGRDP